MKLLKQDNEFEFIQDITKFVGFYKWYITYLLGNSQQTNKVLVTTYVITLSYSFGEIILFSTSNLRNKKGVHLLSCQFETKS